MFSNSNINIAIYVSIIVFRRVPKNIENIRNFNPAVIEALNWNTGECFVHIILTVDLFKLFSIDTVSVTGAFCSYRYLNS